MHLRGFVIELSAVLSLPLVHSVSILHHVYIRALLFTHTRNLESLPLWIYNASLYYYRELFTNMPHMKFNGVTVENKAIESTYIKELRCVYSMTAEESLELAYVKCSCSFLPVRASIVSICSIQASDL